MQHPQDSWLAVDKLQHFVFCAVVGHFHNCRLNESAGKLNPSWQPYGELEDCWALQVAILAFVGASRVDALKPHQLALAASISILAGLAKEAGDYYQVDNVSKPSVLLHPLGWGLVRSICAQLWPGEPSLRDFGADLLGTVAGLAAVVMWQACKQRQPSRAAKMRLQALYQQV